MFKRFLFLLLFFFIIFQSQVFAQSNYVLPYPPAMPGSFSYKIRTVWERLSKYWYFGDFGQFDYNLKLSDKYLVQAKTLFEYKQYLLGYQALQKSDSYYILAKESLRNANSAKNISEEEKLFKEASEKHIEVLYLMNYSTPKTFNWSPEKSKPQNLEIWKEIEDSINIRK